MGYLLTLHRDAALSLSSTEPVVPAAQLAPLRDAFALVEQLSQLIGGEERRLTQAEQEARALGMQAGHDSGREQARQRGAAELADALARLAHDQVEQREELRQALIALASAMVRRMTSELAPAAVLVALAERSFEHVVPAQPVRLRVPSELLESVRSELGQRELAMPVQCMADDQLQGLQCVVESSAGTLLAGLDDVLSRTAHSLETHRRAHVGAGTQEALP